MQLRYLIELSTNMTLTSVGMLQKYCMHRIDSSLEGCVQLVNTGLVITQVLCENLPNQFGRDNVE